MKLNNTKHITKDGLIKNNPRNKILYHGSKFYFEKFNLDNIGLDSNDEEGVGIYFTDSLNEAKYYGGYIYTTELKPSKRVKLKGLVDKRELLFLINNSPDKDMDLSNYGESEREALKNFFEINSNYDNQPHEYFKTIWYEFYRYKPKQFIINMIKLGYDYVRVPKELSNHYVVYNPDKIKIKKIIKR